MNKFENNSSLAINFFKTNYIKIIIFILVSLLISLFFTYIHLKKEEKFFSKFQIIINNGVDIASPNNYVLNLNPFINDVLFYLEKNGITDKKILKSRHANPIIQLEIDHKNLNDKGTDQYNKLYQHIEDYKKELLIKIEKNMVMLTDSIQKKIEKNEDLSEALEIKKIIYLTKANELKRAIRNNELLYVNYDGVIETARRTAFYLKNTIISICISFIIIIIILWSKILLREIKKNS
jgi:hypothetical protein